MTQYRHQAKYYETDQMGIIHHSNYIRWMEEARIAMMEEMGFSYRRMEELGIISPVLSVQCEYKNMVHFDDTVRIEVDIKQYNGIKLTVNYRMINETTGQVCTLGESSHCFLNQEGRIISLRKSCPECDAAFLRYMHENGEQENHD
jgi:acyl-CoA thioester hydrolase